MTSPNRSDARDALAALIEADMGPSGDSLVAAVLTYNTTDLDSESPIVLVYSDGTNRPKREGFGDDSAFANEARLRVDAYVVLPAPEEIGYTRQDAENLLDTIDSRLADLVIATNTSPQWRSLRYDADFSQPEESTLPSGDHYLREAHILIAKLR